MTTDGPPPAELRRSFWTLVAVFNVAVLATGVGLLLVGFWRRPPLGTALLAVGLVAFVYGVHRYRAVRDA